jgi:RNase H-like domain found in reverse transcriptase/Integrase zinc binding domain/Reverse transcriptase (RNA-dependent DNA polymerase)/Integrase core domain
MGLKNSPSSFQRLMETVLHGLNPVICLIYMDDIILFASTVSELVHRTREIFDRFRSVNLKLSVDKCHFVKTSIKYLGHICSGEGISPDPEKTSAVANFPRPKCVKDIQSFLGLVGYYRRFIHNFAEHAVPLNRLIRKNEQFEWGEEQENAFSFFKNALCNPPILRYPDFSRTFILTTDASNYAIGAILGQKSDQDGEQVICYASRQLKDAETRYSTTEKEMLAVVWATKQFRCYLYGRSFEIVTDHRALKWLAEFKDQSSRLTRWALRLSEFEYTITHRPGTAVRNVDALSRYPVLAFSNRSNFIATLAVPYWSVEDVIREQEGDPDCQKIITDIEEGRTAEFNVQANGLLYQERNGIYRLVIPRTMIHKIINHLHVPPCAGHQGIKRTISLISARFYWQTLRSDVEHYISRCIPCQQRKAGKAAKFPLGLFELPDRPFDTVHMDIVGPLPTNPRTRNSYILSFIDHFSKYCELIPIIEISAKTVARHFVLQIILRHGTPLKLVTDRGSNFVSALFQETCRLLQISRIQTTAYHPESNGMVERLHETMADIVSHYVSRNQKDWDQWLPYMAMAYRSTAHTTTGFSPHYLLYGREIRLAMDDDFEPVGVPYDTFDDLQTKLSEAYTLVRERLAANQHKQKSYYDRNKKTRNLNQGDLVFLYDPTIAKTKGSKFRKPWKGPFEILEKYSDLTYRLQLPGKQVVVHGNRLKLYGPSSVAPQSSPKKRSNRKGRSKKADLKPNEWEQYRPEHQVVKTPTPNLDSFDLATPQMEYDERDLYAYLPDESSMSSLDLDFDRSAYNLRPRQVIDYYETSSSFIDENDPRGRPTHP